MWKKVVGLSAGCILVLAVGRSLGQSPGVEISQVNTRADLDLSGNVIYAINFGSNGKPVVGNVVFSQDQEHPAIRLTAEGEGPATWFGAAPGTGDSGLNQLLGGMAYRDLSPTEILVDVQGLVVGGSYRLQLIAYEPANTSRIVDITVDNEQIVAGLNPLAAQGGVVGKGGFVVKYTFALGHPILNIRVVSRTNAAGLCGMILTQLSVPTAFADYGSGTTTELVSGKGTWQLNWGQGPWTWCNNGTAEPLLNSSVSGILTLQATAVPKISHDSVATVPIQGKLTVSAHDKSNSNVVVGTMTLSGTGVNMIDGNASRVFVDEETGIFLAPFRPPGPELALTLDEATGVFAYVKQIENGRLELAGYYAAPLMTGVALQDNISRALGGAIPLVGGVGTFALSGRYEAVESMKPQSFCEYGTGVAVRFGAAGGLWNQTWTDDPWPWHECPTTVNAKFLGQDVSGELETTTSGTPSMDDDLILRLGLNGRITLTDHNETIPANIDGQIKGDIAGTFVVDANAAQATFDANGNIVCPFGVAVHNAPDAFIIVTEATGAYADIHQAGEWAWYVNGTMTIARLVDLPVQQNILAALQKPELLLGAREEFVLTGWYYRAPN
jgi:hypothetical protein